MKKSSWVCGGAALLLGLAACSSEVQEGEIVSVEEALRTAPDAEGRAAATLDLSAPDRAVRFDGASPVALERVRVVGEGGASVPLSELVARAEASAGFATPAGGFVLRGPASELTKRKGVWPPGKCSVITQTDCCECGFWIGSICSGFWCPILPEPRGPLNRL